MCCGGVYSTLYRQVSRSAFANTDLSGDPGHTTAIAEGQRASGQLLDRI
jgi:hypothetical protein